MSEYKGFSNFVTWHVFTGFFETYTPYEPDTAQGWREFVHDFINDTTESNDVASWAKRYILDVNWDEFAEAANKRVVPAYIPEPKNV
jgi:hypothetical protein